MTRQWIPRHAWMSRAAQEAPATEQDTTAKHRTEQGGFQK